MASFPRKSRRSPADPVKSSDIRSLPEPFSPPGPAPGGENGSGRDLMSELLTGSAGERRLFLGNEAIVRGALEAGVALVTTYPGTPASEIGDRCYEISRQTDLRFEYSTNEKVALEVAAGAAACGWRVLCAMKHAVSYTPLRAHETRHDLVC